MALLQSPVKFSDFIAAMITDVNDTIVPPNSVSLGLNLDFDVILGAAVSRLGTTIVGSQLVDAMNILGLYQHVDPTNASNNVLFAGINASGSGVFTAAVSNTITDTAHGLINGDKIWVSNSGGALPAGLTASTNYFVISATADTFEVSLTFGGAAVDITDAGTGTHTWTHKGARIYNVVTGAASAGGFTQSTKMRFLTFGGSTLVVNGVDAERSYTTSGGWIVTGGVFDLADFPSSNTGSLAVEFLDRIYTNETTVPYRVHYSGLFDGSVVAWASEYVDIEPESQGGKITGFAKVPGYVLFFKERSLHRWNFSSAFPESLVQVGAPSQESIVQSGGLVFFYSNSSDDARGFYVTNGGRPQCLSQDTTRSVKRFIDAIPSANEADICGTATDRVIEWSVGNLTVDGETYSNVVFKYNRILNQWSIRTYPSRFMVFANYLVSGVNARVGGDNDGTVFRIDVPSTYKDNATPIEWKLRTQHETFGTNRMKTFTEHAIVRGEYLVNMIISLIPDGDFTLRKIVSSGSSWLRKLLFYFKVGTSISATTLAVELSGSTTAERAVIKEIEVPTVDVKSNYD